MHTSKLSLISLKKHDRRIRHGNTRHTRHTRHHSGGTYTSSASARSARLSAARLSVMYNRPKAMWCWAIARSRSPFDMRSGSAAASRAAERTRAKDGTRLRCDSRGGERDRIRRRSGGRGDRIRRRSGGGGDRIRRRSRGGEENRTRRRCRRRPEGITDDSESESFVRLRADPASAAAATAYLISVAKHKKRILYESFLRLHLSPSEL
jgi:hypothetical protein